jgi:ABC-2 type transport system ATP-binding protein
MIQLNEISKSYGSHKILKSISFTFEKGKVYGVVGENGAGKTTLFKCISGIEEFEGSIKSDFEILKNKLGFLQTDNFFFPKITGEEYLQLLCNARKVKTPNFNEKNIFELPLNQYAISYSTGMKKKLALTGILLQNNDVFILDEPFNGVDIQSNIIITEIIQKLKSLNKTVIISSHIFSTLNDTCDEILHIKEGTISQHVLKADFSVLEEEMKTFMIGDKIERLGLQ